MPLIIATAAGWSALIALSGGLAMPHYCLPPPLSLENGFRLLPLLPRLYPPLPLVGNTALMLVAMMTPLVIAPVQYVRDRSFSHRRARSITLFLVAYALVWIIAGCALVTMMIVLRLQLADTKVLAIAVIALAIAWQCSPLKQRCLNYCHFRPTLAALGTAADGSVICYGMTYGAWCVSTCLILMAPTLLMFGSNLVGMVALSFWVFAERLERPTPPTWRIRVPTKIFRAMRARPFTI